jgi:hypothetical protein
MSRVLRAFWLAVAAGALAFGAMAQPALRDPAVPEALRHARPAAETRGEALQAQVQAKLRARFDAADTTGAGHITQSQAQAAGLGYVARHFDEIDAGRHGSVSWAQVQAWLAQRKRQR